MKIRNLLFTSINIVALFATYKLLGFEYAVLFGIAVIWGQIEAKKEND